MSNSKEIEVTDRTKALFRLPSGTTIEVSIRDGALRIEAESEQLLIIPAGTNVVRITTKDAND